MAKDFSYLFYPGDVLRQVQFFNSAQKSCYLDVLTSHIENIRFSYDFLMKITRNLNEDERRDFLEIFEKDDKGYFLEWAFVAIEKRSAYLLSRSANKAGKKKVSSRIKNKKSYENHMENKNENENKEESVILNEIKTPLSIAFDEWVAMRKKMKGGISERAIELGKSELKKLSGGSQETAIAIINQSILNSWKGFFPIKNSNNGTKKTGHDIDRAMELADKVLSGEINTNF